MSAHLASYLADNLPYLYALIGVVTVGMLYTARWMFHVDMLLVTFGTVGMIFFGVAARGLPLEGYPLPDIKYGYNHHKMAGEFAFVWLTEPENGERLYKIRMNDQNKKALEDARNKKRKYGRLSDLIFEKGKKDAKDFGVNRKLYTIRTIPRTIKRKLPPK